MGNDIKSGWTALASALVAMALVAATACGEDDDSAGSGATGGSAGTGGAGGTSAGTVTEGGVCTLGAGLEGLTEARGSGVCKKPTDPCEGGTAADLASALESALGDVGSEFQVDAGTFDLSSVLDPAGDCVSGLICCINTDQCKSMAQQMSASPLGATVQLSCMPENECTGVLSLPVGCPAGNVCCTQLAVPDGGFPLPTGGMAGDQQ